MYIHFDDTLVTGDETIDEQHRELIDWCNDLNDPDSALVRTGMAEQALRFLVRYVDYHFEAEERAMHASSYPKLASHIKAHSWFRDQVRGVDREIVPGGDTRALALRLRFLIQDWFLQHIRQDDKHVASWLRDHPVPPELADRGESVSDFFADTDINVGELRELRFVRTEPQATRRPGE
jgi:hemerythrin